MQQPTYCSRHFAADEMRTQHACMCGLHGRGPHAWCAANLHRTGNSPFSSSRAPRHASQTDATLVVTSATGASGILLVCNAPREREGEVADTARAQRRSCLMAMKPLDVMSVCLAVCIVASCAAAFDPFAQAAGGGGGGRPTDPQQDAIPAGPYVYELSVAELRGGALADGRLWFVEYYVPWCR